MGDGVSGASEQPVSVQGSKTEPTQKKTKGKTIELPDFSKVLKPAKRILKMLQFVRESKPNSFHDGKSLSFFGKLKRLGSPVTRKRLRAKSASTVGGLAKGLKIKSKKLEKTTLSSKIKV